MDKKEELHELIEVQPKILRKYYVTLTWFMKDIADSLFGLDLQMDVDSDDDVEVISTKYEVLAMTITEAINQAKLIDGARKMEMISGYHNVIYLASEDGKCDYDYETIESFRKYMIDENHFTGFFLTDPTSISAYLADNEELVKNQTINNVMEQSDNIGDNMENWLKNRDDKENKDS